MLTTIKLAKVGVVQTLLKITHLASKNLVIICPNSYEKLTKSEINFAQNHPISENCQKVSKLPNFTLFDLSDLEKLPLERFNQLHLLAVHQHSPWEGSFMPK